mmetsp:Transcript_111063/g.220934  ORF Transcript_111063/g.220934 Transcript_111063/m.220934 type:complete len:128 (+) Transcript_111063:311-694(+)
MGSVCCHSTHHIEKLSQSTQSEGLSDLSSQVLILPQKSFGKHQLMMGIMNQHCLLSSAVAVCKPTLVVLIVVEFLVVISTPPVSSTPCVLAHNKDGLATKEKTRNHLSTKFSTLSLLPNSTWKSLTS